MLSWGSQSFVSEWIPNLQILLAAYGGEGTQSHGLTLRLTDAQLCFIASVCPLSFSTTQTRASIIEMVRVSKNLIHICFVALNDPFTLVSPSLSNLKHADGEKVVVRRHRDLSEISVCITSCLDAFINLLFESRIDISFAVVFFQFMTHKKRISIVVAISLLGYFSSSLEFVLDYQTWHLWPWKSVWNQSKS